jgi:hypothetical protein
MLDGSRLNTVSGHRDTKATACPGKQLDSKLGWLKQRINTLIGGSVSTPIYLYAVKGGLKQKSQRGWLIYNQPQGKVYVQYGRAL